MIANHEPLVTVIIPAYNAEKYLPECIKSIQSQKYQNLEILVINDGSSDRTKQICDDFSATDSRIIEISQENAGVSAARNRGIQMASGEYIQFVDADDVLKPNAIRLLIHCMDRTSADAVCFQYWEFSDKDGAEPPERQNPEHHEYTVLNRQSTFRWIHQGIINNNVWALFFRRDFLKANQLLFDTTIPFGEDILFIYQAASAMSHLVYLPDRLYGYRNNPQSAVHKRSVEFAESDLHVVSKLDSIQRHGLNLDSNGYPALRKRLLVDAYSMFPNKKTTPIEHDVARRIQTELQHIGIFRGIRGLNTRYAVKFVLIHYDLFDFFYAIHTFFR